MLGCVCSKERIKILEKENNEFKTVNNKTNIEDPKLQNNNLEAEHQSLKLQIQNVLTCEECEDRFDSKTEMKNHLRSKHPETNYKCDECDKCFEDFPNMKLHIQTNYLKIMFKCTECELSCG